MTLGDPLGSRYILDLTLDSPRARGAGLPVCAYRPVGGNIPAGAGSRIHQSAGLAMYGDQSRGGGSSRRQPGGGPAARRGHSRGCGEQFTTATPNGCPAGPSPRARGAGEHLPGVPGTAGTIPAGAGSRVAGHVVGEEGEDHPRGRGEQQAQGYAVGREEGPSPRARGAVGPGPGERRSAGTIPAGAGSRGGAGPAACEGRDHPRGRGEQFVMPRWWAMVSGPSPRARGAVCATCTSTCQQVARRALSETPAYRA
jgi:hypothetical protein